MSSTIVNGLPPPGLPSADTPSPPEPDNRFARFALAINDGEAGTDRLMGASGDDALFGGAGDDTLVGGTGRDALAGGEGSDIYRFNRGDGADTVLETGSSTDQDRIEYDIGAVGFDQLWFRRSGNDVIASIMGSTDSLTIQGWYDGRRIETITAGNTTTASPGDVRSLSAYGLEQLIHAMAAITPPPGATSWGALSSAQHSQLTAMGVWQ